MPSGGTPPYFYQWYAGTTCSVPISGQASSTFSTGPLTTASAYSVRVSDSGSGTPATGSCVSVSVAVGPAFVAPGIEVASGMVDENQSSTLTTVVPLGGGTPPYSCKWLREDPGSSNYTSLGSSFICDIASHPTASTGALAIGGTWDFELQASDSTNATATSAPVPITVIGLVVSCSPSAIVVGSAVRCTAAFNGAFQEGKVVWSKSGSGRFSAGSCALVAGACSVKYTPTSGGPPVTIVAFYRGAVEVPSSTGAFSLAVSAGASRTAVACNQGSTSVSSPTGIRCTVSVSGHSPTGDVSLSQTGTGSVAFASTSCVLSRGKCTVMMTGFSPGSASVLVVYGGDVSNLPSSRAVKLTVRKASPRLTVLCDSSIIMAGGETICTATLLGYGQSISGEQLLWSKASGAGTVSLRPSACLLNPYSNGEACSVFVYGIGSGTVRVAAAYGGDSNNTVNSGSLTLKVTKAPTATLVECVAVSLGVGASTTCTAEVSSPGPPPTGTVTWTVLSKSGAVSFSPKTCSLSLGNCTTAVTVTRAGTIQVKASYKGNPGYSPSSGVFVLPMGTVVRVGGYPAGVAVNPSTGKVYVANFLSKTVSVIDGATNTVVATISGVPSPAFVAVNPVTNIVYVTNIGNNTVSMIDGATNTVVANITVGYLPYGVAVDPVTNMVYVVNDGNDTVSVINGATNRVVANISVGYSPYGVAVNPSTNMVYVANFYGNTVSVINGATNTVVANVSVWYPPIGVAVNPSTGMVYVTSSWSDTVSVIDPSNNTVVADVQVGFGPYGVAVNPSTDTVYVTNLGDNTVSVINGAYNTVVATVATWSYPFGVAVNPSTNAVYVTDAMSGVVSVS